MVLQLEKPAVVEERKQASCTHHWIIEEPTGPVSNGVCRLCDEIREFKNYIGPAPTFQNDDPSRYAVVSNHGLEEESEEF